MDTLFKWPCGHITDLIYQKSLGECPVCALEQGRYYEITVGREQQRQYDADVAAREAIYDSKMFNRCGCPYCGGIW